MSFFGWIMIILLGLLANAIGAYLMKGAAIQKGYGEDIHVWAICFFLGIFGYLYIIALPDKVVQSQNQQIIYWLREKGEDYD